MFSRCQFFLVALSCSLEAVAEDYASRVHHYNETTPLLAKNFIYFTSDEDHQLYAFSGPEMYQITFSPQARFRDGCFNHADDSLLYVRDGREDLPRCSVVRIDGVTCEIKTLASGRDFYATLRISPDDRFLAFLCWNQDWKGSELRVVDLHTFSERLVAGGENESVVDPTWDAEGRLYYVSERDGSWAKRREGESEPTPAEPEPEFQLPSWLSFD